MLVKSITVQYLVQASMWGEYWVNLSKRGGKDGVIQKPCPSQLFYSDLHSIPNRFPYWPSLNAETVPYRPS